MSTYGFNLVDIRWGKNKEHLPLRQTLEVVVYSLADICKAFGLRIPDNSAPVHVSKAKSLTRRRGRPAKAKTENQEL